MSTLQQRSDGPDLTLEIRRRGDRRIAFVLLSRRVLIFFLPAGLGFRAPDLSSPPPAAGRLLPPIAAGARPLLRLAVPSPLLRIARSRPGLWLGIPCPGRHRLVLPNRPRRREDRPPPRARHLRHRHSVTSALALLRRLVPDSGSHSAAATRSFPPIVAGARPLLRRLVPDSSSPSGVPDSLSLAPVQVSGWATSSSSPVRGGGSGRANNSV